MDKWQRFADFLVNYSTRIKAGEIALIHCVGDPREEFISNLMEGIFRAGGQVIIWKDNPIWTRQMLMSENSKAMALLMGGRLKEIKKVQACFHMISIDNEVEMADVPSEKMKDYRLLVKPISYWRCNKTKRVLTYLPTRSSAQSAGMSTAQFENFYFDACLGVNYVKMSQAMDILVEKMRVTDKVRIVGEKTNISFSIKGIPAIKCVGTENIPDGEIFTAPIRESVKGTVSYNTPSVYGGYKFGPMSLSFDKGRLYNVMCEDAQQQKKAEEIFNTDEGARYIGEFAIGLNPRITSPVGETLFDEKIAGSIHLTPGNCYDQAPNGNKSVVHWDLILRQTADCGGGEIYFDGKLIRKDGLFLGNLAVLNPRNLAV